MGTFSKNEGFLPTAVFKPEIGVLTLNFNGDEFDFIVENYCDEPESTDEWIGFVWKHGEYDLNFHNYNQEGRFQLTISEYIGNWHGIEEEISLIIV
jgi:hypothetical protein